MALSLISARRFRSIESAIEAILLDDDDADVGLEDACMLVSVERDEKQHQQGYYEYL